MPATITVQELAAALRLSDGSAVPEEPLQSILLRQLETARELVNQYAPTAPDTTLDAAIIQICGYLYDAPNTALNNAPHANAFRFSGAMALLAGWHVSQGVTI